MSAAASLLVSAKTPARRVRALTEPRAALDAALRATHVLLAPVLAEAIRAAAQAEWDRREALRAGDTAGERLHAARRDKATAKGVGHRVVEETAR